jgi:hypothetical protein
MEEELKRLFQQLVGKDPRSNSYRGFGSNAIRKFTSKFGAPRLSNKELAQSITQNDIDLERDFDPQFTDSSTGTEEKTKRNLFGNLFGTKHSPIGEQKGTNSLLSGLDVAKLGLDVGAPLAYELSNVGRRNELKDASQVELEDIELAQPGVRGLRKRNLALPSRPPKGSTLDSQIAEDLFSDAFLQAQENEFNINDENFRQQQRDRNTQIGNQESIINKQSGDQEELFNATTAKQELLGINLPDKVSTYESMFQNVSQGLGQVSALDSITTIETARDIIKNPENYTEAEKIRARQILSGQLRLGKKGGKLNTKFSS